MPEYAFEVEHTTEVTKGIGRLFDLYKAGLRMKLFIILPDKKLDKFRPRSSAASLEKSRRSVKLERMSR